MILLVDTGLRYFYNMRRVLVIHLASRSLSWGTMEGTMMLSPGLNDSNRIVVVFVLFFKWLAAYTQLFDKISRGYEGTSGNKDAKGCLLSQNLTNCCRSVVGLTMK